MLSSPLLVGFYFGRSGRAHFRPLSLYNLVVWPALPLAGSLPDYSGYSASSNEWPEANGKPLPGVWLKRDQVVDQQSAWA